MDEYLNKIINSFLDVTGYDVDPNVLAIILHGSRIRETNREDSDLDVLIITSDGGNGKITFSIDGILFDCNFYNVNTLYDAVLNNVSYGNCFFDVVLDCCMVIKNENMTVELFEQYVDELRIDKRVSRKIRVRMARKIRDLYEDFKINGLDYQYYNLLELIRKNYHYNKGFSYVSVNKVGKIYRNKERYEEEYGVLLPSHDFMKMYLEFISVKDYDKRIEVIESFLKMIDLKHLDKTPEGNIYDSKNNKITILINRVDELLKMYKNDDSYFILLYNVVLKEFYDFFSEEGLLSDEIYRIILDGINVVDNKRRMDVVMSLYEFARKSYDFDCDDNVLKL